MLHTGLDHGSVSGCAHVPPQKADELPECPSSLCCRELHLYSLPFLLSHPWSSLPHATSCNIYKSHRATWLFFWVLLHSWALFPTTLGNTGPAAGPFQHSSCTSNPAALPLPGGLNVHKKNWAGINREPWPTELKLLSFLIQSLCNLSFGEISWSFLCGFSFHPICSWISEIRLI